MKYLFRPLIQFVLFTGLLSALHSPARAQIYTTPPDTFGSRLRFGGGLGLSFGNDAFLIGLTPSAIYQANEYLAFGVGLNYTYSKVGDDKLNAVGGSLIALANPIPALQLSAEFEELYVDRDFGFFSESYWVPALYLGVGYGMGPVTFGIRYDVLYDDNKSLYANPWLPFVRVYF